MTTNKPEVVYANSLYSSAFEACLMRRTGEKGEPVVRLSDYEALQAECEKLRKDAERLDWVVSEGAIVARAGVRGEPHRYRVEWPLLGEVGINWFTSERDAIDAAMQETNNDNQ